MQDRAISRRAALVGGGSLLAAILWPRAKRAGRVRGGTSMSSTYYVSPTGSDSAAGSLAAPWATVAHAQTVAAPGDTVYLRGGTYYLAATLAFGAGQSGTAGSPITYAAYPGETPILSGGVVVTGWTPHTIAIWQASVPSGSDFRQLYVNGTRRTRAAASWTHGGSTNTTGIAGTDGALASWGNQSAIELLFRPASLPWIAHRCPVQSASGAGITMNPTGWVPIMQYRGGLIAPSSVYGVENAYELLGNPGQFYLDKTASVLYYVPPTGEDLTTATVIRPALQTLVQINGGHDLAFRGIAFQHANWTGPNTTGFATFGSGSYFADGNPAPALFGGVARLPGGISVDNGLRVVFDRCSVTKGGASGFGVQAPSAQVAIRGCTITDLSGGGVEIGLPTDARVTAPATNIDVAHCTIHDLAVEYIGACGAELYYGAQIHLDNNLIYNLPYDGISVGWGNGDPSLQPNVCQHVYVRHNHVHHCMQTLNDGGGIYAQSPCPDLQIVANVIHDVPATTGGALYLDDGVEYGLVRNNVTYACANTLWNHDTIGNTQVEHNIVDASVVGGGPGPLTGSGGAPATLLKENQVVTNAAQRPAGLLNAAGPQPPYTIPTAGDPPSPPTAVHVGSPSGNSLPITWAAPTYHGQGGITGYEVWLNGWLAATSASAAYTYDDLLPSTTYSVVVYARDAAGNRSAPSVPVSTTTSSGITPRTNYGTGFI